MPSIKSVHLSLVLFLRLLEFHVVVAVEVVVLLKMLILNFFLARLVLETQILILESKLLLLQLAKAILRHFSLFKNTEKDRYYDE